MGRRGRGLSLCLLAAVIGLVSAVVLTQALDTSAQIAVTRPVRQPETTISVTRVVTSSPHLGYGINVRTMDNIDPLYAPLGLEWVKLWEEYAVDPPDERLPYKVLFAIQCDGMPEDLSAWGEHVEGIARAGLGRVEAYEVCNEPNVKSFWGESAPDPGEYVAVLETAHARIKAVDPAAIIVSAGLAPVGRVEGACNGWSGNNCGAMDEREYARQMLLLGAGDHFDAFGYHPYGYAYTPETDPHSVSNGFAFRGTEVMYDLLEQFDLGHKPIWATEFSWLRDPSEDGAFPDWCHREDDFQSFEWMVVPEVQQANYITRAFQYADANWPWMEAMFVWNLDWHDYNWLCEPARYFSVLKVDYTDYNPFQDPPPAPYTATLAYKALAAMDKRPGPVGCRLRLEPGAFNWSACPGGQCAGGALRSPTVFTGVVSSSGLSVCDPLTWTATFAPSSTLRPTLWVTQGQAGESLTFTLDTGTFMTQGTGTVLLYPTGTYTTLLTLTTAPSDVIGSPETVQVRLVVSSKAFSVYLPVVNRADSPPTAATRPSD